MAFNRLKGRPVSVPGGCISRLASSRPTIKRNWESIRKVTKNTDLALGHFDGLYSRVYGRDWPSVRLGLLSPKKYCAVLNSFTDTDELIKTLTEEQGAIDLARYYKKHQQSYTRWKLREQIIENKKTRKREMMAKSANIDVEQVDPDSIEVSDVSDSELRGAQTTDQSDGFSTAEDLMAMFSDRRMDEDEKYFINRASTQLSLNDFVPTTELLRREEIGNDLMYYEGYNPDITLNVDRLEDPTLEFCEQLKIFTFPRNEWLSFEEPTLVEQAQISTHYVLDGASILPVLALDLQMDDVCADYCASPGGKSLAMLMTLRPKHILCNDISLSRLERLTKVMRQYAPDISYTKSCLNFSRVDARKLIYPDTFDKILVDVPCSNDRCSVELLDNNIFKRARSQERLNLPTLQSDILKSALKSLKPKGVVVYSTCTMSPLENDAVVQRTLMQLEMEASEMKFAVVGLKEAFRPLRGLYKFKDDFKYGSQVVPSICSNFGPMYICKLKRMA